MAMSSLPKTEYVDAVLNLIELTQKGELAWHPVRPPHDQLKELRVSESQYEADFQGVRLVLSSGHATTPAFKPKNAAESILLVLTAPTGIKLQAIKPDGEIVADFPDIPALRSL